MSEKAIDTFYRAVIGYLQKKRGFTSVDELQTHIDNRIPEALYVKMLTKGTEEGHLMFKGLLYKITDKGRKFNVNQAVKS